MSDVGDRVWLRRRGIGGVVDGGTWLVLLLWAGILALVPERPVVNALAPLSPACIITALPASDDLPLALRPDLIALPSAVSFGAGGPSVDALYGVPPFKRRTERWLSLPVTDFLPAEETFRADTLRKEMAETIGDVLLPEIQSVPAANPVFPVFTGNLDVICSPGLENTQLQPGVMSVFSVTGDVKHVEAELWVQFDAAGQPVEIFLEQCSVDPVEGQALVRRLWNPASWTNAAGQGRISIRYLPKTGGADANTDNKLEAR